MANPPRWLTASYCAGRRGARDNASGSRTGPGRGCWMPTGSNTAPKRTGCRSYDRARAESLAAEGAGLVYSARNSISRRCVRLEKRVQGDHDAPQLLRLSSPWPSCPASSSLCRPADCRPRARRTRSSTLGLRRCLERSSAGCSAPTGEPPVRGRPPTSSGSPTANPSVRYGAKADGTFVLLLPSEDKGLLSLELTAVDHQPVEVPLATGGDARALRGDLGRQLLRGAPRGGEDLRQLERIRPWRVGADAAPGGRDFRLYHGRSRRRGVLSARRSYDERPHGQWAAGRGLGVRRRRRLRLDRPRGGRPSGDRCGSGALAGAGERRTAAVHSAHQPYRYDRCDHIDARPGAARVSRHPTGRRRAASPLRAGPRPSSRGPQRRPASAGGLTPPCACSRYLPKPTTPRNAAPR